MCCQSPVRPSLAARLPDCRFELRVEAQGELHEDFRSRIEATWSQLNNGPDKWPLSIERVDEIESTPSGKQLDFVSAFHAAEKDFH